MKSFRLINQNIKRNCLAYIANLPTDENTPLVVTVKEAGRNLDQSAKFHALCHDVSQQTEYLGKTRTAEQWKVLFVSGHAMATGNGAEVVPGLEGEWCNIRESTARMSKARMASLIEYVLAYCANNNIRLNDEREEDTRICQG